MSKEKAATWINLFNAEYSKAFEIEIPYKHNKISNNTKSKCGSPLTAKYMPLKKHELILVFGKSASYYKPQMVEGTPYKRNSKKGVNNMEYGAKDNYLYGSVDGKRHPNTILNFAQKWRR